MINLMIVEDNEIVRRGLVKFLSQEEDIHIMCGVSDGVAALSQLQTDAKIDIAIVDWNMPDMNGLELTARITSSYPHVKIIILTMHSNQDYKDKARAAGAKGYILKQGDFDALIIAIKEVAAGKMVYM